MVAVTSPVIGAPMTALLLVFEMTRSYEITIAAMVAIVFANLIAYQWFGRSLYDFQLNQRGIDLSMGRERAYLMHRKVANLVTDSLPVVQQDISLSELRECMAEKSTASAVVVGADRQYLGQVSQHQLHDRHESSRVSAIDIEQGHEFNENTSIWEAMEIMREYIGEAIPLIDSTSGRYLGAIPEAVVINAYLDASHELRREEYEV